MGVASELGRRHEQEPQPRRVVITGIGAVTPIGLDAPTTWQNALRGTSGISELPFEYLGTKLGGSIPRFTGLNDRFVSTKDQRGMARVAQLSLQAADEALGNSRLLREDHTVDEHISPRMGVSVGCCYGDVEEAAEVAKNAPAQRVSPRAALRHGIERVATLPSMRFGITGPVVSVNNACASGISAIADGARKIRTHEADFMLVGATEGCMNLSGLAMFGALRALSKTGIRPLDRNRDGLLLGEGAAMIILEDLDHALRRRANVYAELLGYGETADGIYGNDTNPHPDGKGLAQAMRLAIKRSGNLPQSGDIFLSGHLTATQIGDLAELAAINETFREEKKRLIVNAAKSMTGHGLAFTGALATILSALALRDQIVPPTINLIQLDPAAEDLRVPQEAIPSNISFALINAAGFGGPNASLALKRYEE